MSLQIVAPLVLSKKYLGKLLKQSQKQRDGKYPLRGIEHIFVKGDGNYCKWCSEREGNLMHIRPDQLE